MPNIVPNIVPKIEPAPEREARVWEDVLVQIAEELRHTEWRFIFELVQCHEQLGEEFYGVLDRVAARIRRDVRTLANYESCARRAIMNKWFRPALTLGHHMAVDRRDLDDKDKLGLLKWAETNPGTTVQELRARARQVLAIKQGHALPPSEEDSDDNPQAIRPALAFDGTVSFHGTVTISPAGKGGYILIFDSEEVSFKCHVTHLERL